MEQIAPGQWVKPANGYKDADPGCPLCGGGGESLEQVHLPDPEETVLWVGRCPACGIANGGYFQRAGMPDPEIDEYWRCVMDDCERPSVEFILASEVTAWSIVCPLCSTKLFGDFLQRVEDAPPTVLAPTRMCPQCGCQDTVWKLGAEILGELGL
ncbi:MAG: hypothetical protein WD200_00660 [Candidatus Andersenbacteria bacterium]